MYVDRCMQWTLVDIAYESRTIIYLDQSRLEAFRRRHGPRHTTTSACGVPSPTSPGDDLESRMALHIFPDCCLRQGIEAEPVAFAVDPYRREFLLTKHGDDPMQRNTAGLPDKFGVHESYWRDLSRQSDR